MAGENKNSEWPGPYQFGTEPEPPAPSPASTATTTPTEEVKVSTDVEQPAPTASTDKEQPAVDPEERKRIDATAGTDRNIKTLQDWLDANPQETEEQRKKREKREKSKKLWAAIGDGISAMSNLYFTTQYAPNMYNHEKQSMYNATVSALDKAKAERDKNRDQYMQFSLKLGDLQNQKAATLRELEAQAEKMKLAREKAERDAEKHGWEAALQPHKLREQAGKADKAEAEAEYTPELYRNKTELERERVQTEKHRQGSLDASAANSRASAALSNARRGRLGNKDGFWVDTADGGVEWIADSDIDRYFTELSDDERQEAGNNDAYGGYSKPNKEQKKQAIAEKRARDKAERDKAAGDKAAGEAKGGYNGKLKNTKKLGL